MRPVDSLLLLLYALGLSVGQVLFKSAAPAGVGSNPLQAFIGLMKSPAFLSGALLYALLMFFWTWLLSRVPLTQAYPYVALCFVFVPLMAWVFFGERVAATYWIGLFLVVIGVVFIGFGIAREQ